jgi:hypothetical protein
MSVGGGAQGGAEESTVPSSDSGERPVNVRREGAAPAEPGGGEASAGAADPEEAFVASHGAGPSSSFLTDGHGRPIKRPSEESLRRIDALFNPPRLLGIQPEGVESIFDGLEFAVVDRDPGEEGDGQGDRPVRAVVLRRIPHEPLVRLRNTRRRTEG